MRKMFFLGLAAAALLLTVTAQNAQAQSSETPKVEVGVHYTLLRLRDFDTTDNGVGTRVTYNLTDNIGLEGEINFFPKERPNFALLSASNSRRTQGLFGVKYAIARSEGAGIFAKVRPGFVRFGEGTVGAVTIPGATEFALDFGGVFELYASRNIAFRFDIGDTIIRFGNLGFTSHNLQVSPGVVFRF
jgi:hypothetical protein